MTSNGKILNYKIVDLVERYNFHIKFIFIRVQTKNYKFLKTDCTPTAVAHDGSRATVPRAPTAVGHSGRSMPPSLRR
jgi:hypothetical protein